jgi:hypothetical protein
LTYFHFTIFKFKTFCVSGSEAVDQILSVLLSTSMFVGGVIGFVLDVTIPGKIMSYLGGDCRGRDRMVFGLTTTYAISVNHH